MSAMRQPAGGNQQVTSSTGRPTTAASVSSGGPDARGGSADATPNDPKGGIMGEITLSKTEAAITRGSAQLRVGSLEGLIKSDSGMDQGMISANKGRFLSIGIRRSDGTEGVLLMGDTHAIWGQHQKKGPSQDLFDEINGYCNNGEEVTLTVISINKVGNGWNKTGTKDPNRREGNQPSNEGVRRL